jgi:hypothetical protein
MEKRRPYWLSGGTERCRACSHAYVLEMEYRCAACDGGLCALCVVIVRETGTRLCPACRSDGEEGD